MMDLYFAPLACSMASRITLHETGAPAEAVRFLEVDAATKRLHPDGGDYWAVNPMGQVPALRLETGEMLTENAAILLLLAERFGGASLAPVAGPERDRLRRWLSFIGTELHATLFHPIFDPKAPVEAKAYARTKASLRWARLAAHLDGRDHLLETGFSVADAYLATVLGWLPAAGLDITPWPVLAAWHRRILARPSVARALAEERPLHAAQQARRAA
jgi:glutathione S-transferase